MIRRGGVSRATKPSKRRVGANKMARARREHGTEKENGTEKEAPVTAALTPSELHQLLAAYYAALIALKAPPPPTQVAGLNALLYWQEKSAHPSRHVPTVGVQRVVPGPV